MYKITFVLLFILMITAANALSFQGRNMVYYPDEKSFGLIGEIDYSTIVNSPFTSPSTQNLSTPLIFQAKGLQLTGGTKPVCDSSTHGSFWFTAGSLGVADKIEFCVKTALDTYVWLGVGLS